VNVDLAELAQLPAVVRQLQDRVRELEAHIQAPKPLVDAKQAAKLLGMSPAAVRAAAYRGTVKSVRVGRSLRFDPNNLRR
jgi:hypothetical protein